MSLIHNISARLVGSLPPSAVLWIKKRYYPRVVDKLTRVEPEIAALSDLVHPGNTVVDAGANIGV